MLFADAGLSASEISSLFAIWSVTSFILEVPSGVWADIFSRRLVVAAVPALTGAGFALWTFIPSYPTFALGFVLWGAGSALRSGALQALVYAELTRIGESAVYPRLIGRCEAVSATAVMAATAVAAPVFSLGGYRAVGIASVVVTILGVAVGCSLPDARVVPARAEAGRIWTEVLQSGLAELRRTPPVRRRLMFVAVFACIGALDEYVPLLVQSTGVGPPTVPLFVAVIALGGTVGGWLAGRGTRWTGPALTGAAGCLALGSASGHPAGLVPVAVAFGIFQWCSAAADARLQESIADAARATVTSMAGLGAEVVALLTFAGYALGSRWAEPGPLFAMAALPYLVLGLALRGPR